MTTATWLAVMPGWAINIASSWENAMVALESRRVAGWMTVSMLVCAPTWALAQQGTVSEREACTPDAFRLCGHYIPDADRIANCLHDAGPRLSPACYEVFYPQSSQPPNARARNARTVKRQYAPPRRSDDDDD